MRRSPAAAAGALGRREPFVIECAEASVRMPAGIERIVGAGV
jgi:hypothetical protein